MTDQEKKDQPKFYVMTGYLKTYNYHEAWKNLWDKLPQARKDMLVSIPEFDPAVFKEITGIDVSGSSKKDELIKKAQELLDKAKELQDQANNL
jgi:uncharacterized membrane protein